MRLGSSFHSAGIIVQGQASNFRDFPRVRFLLNITVICSCDHDHTLPRWAWTCRSWMGRQDNHQNRMQGRIFWAANICKLQSSTRIICGCHCVILTCIYYPPRSHLRVLQLLLPGETDNSGIYEYCALADLCRYLVLLRLESNSVIAGTTSMEIGGTNGTYV